MRCIQIRLNKSFPSMCNRRIFDFLNNILIPPIWIEPVLYVPQLSWNITSFDQFRMDKMRSTALFGPFDHANLRNQYLSSVIDIETNLSGLHRVGIGFVLIARNLTGTAKRLLIYTRNVYKADLVLL